MAGLKDRLEQQKSVTPTSTVTEAVVGKKKKYTLSISFDGDWETDIKERAKARGIGIAAYIRQCVAQDLGKYSD